VTSYLHSRCASQPSAPAPRCCGRCRSRCRPSVTAHRQSHASACRTFFQPGPSRSPGLVLRQSSGHS
jgi:hypothetical protein